MAAPVKEDFLDEDNEIPGQRFCLLSFLSPEKVLARKDLFFFEHFLKNYEVTWKTKNLEKFLAKQVMDFNKKLDDEATRLMESDLSGASDICRQSRIRVDGVLDSYQAYVKENATELKQTTIKEAYDDFVYAHGKKIEEQFHAKNEFQTSIRGVKLRGNYATQEEATARAKKLQRQDPVHNIFVAQVGKWLAWDPNPHDVSEHEYAEDQLNDLMKSYKENEEARDQFYAKNPDAKNGSRKTGARTEKEIMNVVGATEEETTNEVVSGEHSSLFTGPDLALQRKMERDAAAAEKKDESS
jgi:hypothetical protein